MRDNFWRGPQRLRVVFLGIMILLTATLGIVAWWLFQQDQQLAIQRLGERQETAADLLVVLLEKNLTATDRILDQLLTQDGNPIPSPDFGATYVRFTRSTLRTWPDHALAYNPLATEPLEMPESSFTVADELEFKDGNYSGAIAALSEASASSDPNTRAAALVRIARNYRKSGRPQDSLRASRQLANLGSVSVSGLPAAIAGGLAALYAMEQGHDPSLPEAAQGLNHQLSSGQWNLSQAAYDASVRELDRWLPAEQLAPRPAALAEGVDWLWRTYERDEGHAHVVGRQILVTPIAPLLLQWKTSGNVFVGFVADADYLQTKWLSETQGTLDNLHVNVALTDSEGHLFLGKLPEGAKRPAIKLSSATALPWTVQVFNTASEASADRARRYVFLLGTSILAALILTGFGFVAHAISRELAVARFQTDFVSTVSHEFRTPLTTLCQLSELLKRNRVASVEDQQQYFELLHTESNRLRRLVEGLLNLGRIEAGKLQFRFEPIDAAEFVRQSVLEFDKAQQTRDHHFQVQAEGRFMVQADRETLQCALWNLFENAVKYSPQADTVWVKVSGSDNRVEIAVTDQGVGIPSNERRHVFDRFVRGSRARASNISGTGIGLSMAREIVQAHGGEIAVDGQDGEGSTFRILLPAFQNDL